MLELSIMLVSDWLIVRSQYTPPASSVVTRDGEIYGGVLDISDAVSIRLKTGFTAVFIPKKLVLAMTFGYIILLVNIWCDQIVLYVPEYDDIFVTFFHLHSKNYFWIT